MRKLDRIANWENWPKLFYPELYLLYGGYQNFFQEKNEYCEPRSYISMFDRKFQSTCKGEVRLARRRELTRSLSFSGPFGSRSLLKDNSVMPEISSIPEIPEISKSSENYEFGNLDEIKINFSGIFEDKENITSTDSEEIKVARKSPGKILSPQENTRNGVPRLVIWNRSGKKKGNSAEKFLRVPNFHGTRKLSRLRKFHGVRKFLEVH